ncbi:MAG: hypothetical protein LBD47_12080 [Treponema sp.]|nr:hypothetical protein [Treponema sp.]
MKTINTGQFIPKMGVETIYMYKTPQIFHPFFPPPPVFPGFVHKISTSAIESNIHKCNTHSDCPALFGSLRRKGLLYLAFALLRKINNIVIQAFSLAKPRISRLLSQNFSFGKAS